jgi:hypothetical protein
MILMTDDTGKRVTESWTAESFFEELVGWMDLGEGDRMILDRIIFFRDR